MRLTHRRMTLRGVGLEQALLTPCLLGGLVAQMQTGEAFNPVKIHQEEKILARAQTPKTTLCFRSSIPTFTILIVLLCSPGHALSVAQEAGEPGVNFIIF